MPIKTREGAPLWDRLIDFMWPRQEAPRAATEEQRSRDRAQARLEKSPDDKGQPAPAEERPHFLPTCLASYRGCYTEFLFCLAAFSEKKKKKKKKKFELEGSFLVSEDLWFRRTNVR